METKDAIAELNKLYLEIEGGHWHIPITRNEVSRISNPEGVWGALEKEGISLVRCDNGGVVIGDDSKEKEFSNLRKLADRGATYGGADEYKTSASEMTDDEVVAALKALGPKKYSNGGDDVGLVFSDVDRAGRSSPLAREGFIYPLVAALADRGIFTSEPNIISGQKSLQALEAIGLNVSRMAETTKQEAIEESKEVSSRVNRAQNQGRITLSFIEEETVQYRNQGRGHDSSWM